METMETINKDRMSHSEEIGRVCENPMQNGSFYEWNSMYADSPQNHPRDPPPQDPWIPRRPRSRVSRYFCVRNTAPSDRSTPPDRDREPKKRSPKSSSTTNRKLHSKYHKHSPKLNTSNQTSPTTVNANTTTTSPPSTARSVLKHFRRYLETTSVRGVPKIVLSRRSRQRCLWIVFVTAFFIGCTTSITLLVLQYFNYDVIHQPRTMQNGSADFPSITFCNLRPFSSRISEQFSQMNIMPFDSFIMQYKRQVSRVMIKPNKIKQEELLLLSATKTFALFLMNLPSSVEMNSVGHSLRSMVIKCHVVYESMSDLMGTDCFSSGAWVRTTHSYYLNCYTFTVNPIYQKNTKGIQVMIYLDNKEGTSCPDCSLTDIPALQMTGIRFSLHPAHTYPEMLEEGVNLSPGTFTDAVFETKRWKMMEPPYGKCSKEIAKRRYEFVEGSYRYSAYGCKRHNLQTALDNQCGCVNLYDIPLELKHLLYNHKICKYVPQSVLSNDTYNNTEEDFRKVINYTACEKQITNQIAKYDECFPPCEKYTFMTRISSGIYPTKSHHLSFKKNLVKDIKKTFLKNITKEERLDLEQLIKQLSVYDQIAKMLNSNSTLIQKRGKKLLRDTDFIERNFLSININRADFSAIMLEEKPVITLTSFLSQVGGMFSIWSGITFVCIVELIELLMNIIETLFCNRRPN